MRARAVALSKTTLDSHAVRESRCTRAFMAFRLGVRPHRLLAHARVAHARKGGRQVNSERTRAQATAVVESMLGSLS